MSRALVPLLLLVLVSTVTLSRASVFDSLSVRLSGLSPTHKAFGGTLLVLLVSFSLHGFFSGSRWLALFPTKPFNFSLLHRFARMDYSRKWNPRASRPSREARLARKNGGEVGGLANEGNTCFMNSVLSSMASSTALLRFFNDHVYEETTVTTPAGTTTVKTGVTKQSMRFTAALKVLLDDLNGQYGTRGKEFSTSPLLKKMPDGPKQNFFMGYNQEDAQEFYQSVMRIVEKEYKALMTGTNSEKEKEEKDKEPRFVPAQPGFVSGCANLGQLGTVYVPAHQIDANIPDSDNLVSPLELVTPVDGISAERIGCMACGEIGGIRYAVNSGLSLNLPYDRSYRTQYELTSLLDEWKKPEIIDDVNCNRCGLVQTREFLQESISKAESEKLLSHFAARVEEIDRELEKDYISDEVFEKLTTKQMIRKTRKSKQIFLSRPPPLLCIHINRSVIDPHTFMIVKNSKNLSFPSVLDLAPYVAEPADINMDARRPFRTQDETEAGSFNGQGQSENGQSQDLGQNGQNGHELGNGLENGQNGHQAIENGKPPVNYKLRAVISHMGTHNYGHYICYRRWRGTWWKVNDEAVYVTTENEVLNSPGTFMLFYEYDSGSEDAFEPLTDESEKENDDEDENEETGENAKSDSEEKSSSDSESENFRNTKGWEDEKPEEELFPNANFEVSKFEMGEERAYHV